MSSRDRKAKLAVLGCSAGIFWSGTFAFGYPGLMGPFWRTLFHVDDGAIGIIVTFIIFSLGIFMFLCGKWHLKLGTQKSLLIGTIILAVAMLILNFSKNIYMVYLWAFLVGTSSCFIYGPGITTVQQWFPHRRGLVTGIVNLVFGVSAAIMSPIFYVMLKTLGYEIMNYTLIVLLIVTNYFASRVAEMPEKANLTPEEKEDHHNILAAIQAKAITAAKPAMVSYTVAEALKTRSFWFIWLTWVFMGAAGISMVSLSVNYAVSLGLAGVVVLTSFNLSNGVSRIISGVLSDIIGRNITGCLAFLLSAVGYFLLPKFTGLIEIAILASFVGFAFGTLFAVTAPLASDIFGLKYFGMIFGLIFTAYGFISGIVGPALSGYMLQRTGGNFTVVFMYLAFFSLLAALLFMLARPEKRIIKKAIPRSP